MEGNYVTDMCGGSGWWLIILFVLLFGGNGFGGRGITDATTNELLLGQKFDTVGQKLNSIGDGIASLGYSQLQQMDNNTSAINGNIVNEGRNIQTQLCQINANIDSKFAALEKSQLEQTIQNQAQQINQLYIAQQMSGTVKYPMSSTWAMNGNPFCGCGCYN